MKQSFFFGMILIFGLTSFAQSISFPSASEASQTLDCSAKIQGGDYFPWSNAQPFPWSDIQGVWKLKDGLVPFYLKAKVVRTTSNRKILSLSIVSEGNCTRPVAQGVGYIDLSEKNVVRAIMNDGASRYQMKLASFDSEDLKMDSFSCGENIMAASLRLIGPSKPSKTSSLLSSENVDGAENIMLKKVSDDLGSICKKLGTR